MPCANSTLSDDEVVHTIKTSTRTKTNTNRNTNTNSKVRQQHPQDNNNSQQSTTPTDWAVTVAELNIGTLHRTFASQKDIKQRIRTHDHAAWQRRSIGGGAARQLNENATSTLKTSIYDWDSPSSFTGTVKRRPHSIATIKTATATTKTTLAARKTTSCGRNEASDESSTPSPTANNDGHQLAAVRSAGNWPKRLQQLQHQQQEQQKVNNNRKRRLRHRTIHEAGGKLHQSAAQPSATTKMSSQQHPQNRCKEKPNKLHLPISDRNANSTLDSDGIDNSSGVVHAVVTHVASSIGPTCGTKPKTTCKPVLQPKTENISNMSRKKSKFNGGPDDFSNYMELEFCGDVEHQAAARFTELFCDFPVSYGTTNIGAANQYPACKPPPQPPPFREPPPPTPPPLSQIPSRESRFLAQCVAASGVGAVSVSAPNSPSRGKVVLSKKERKELSKQIGKQQYPHDANSLGYEINHVSASAHSSPYKGRVTELKNCIAKINSRGLFASLHRNSQKSLNQAQSDADTISLHEVSPPPPAPEASGMSTSTTNNNDDTADYSEKLRNLPVRQRKVATSHMDNYCLFDPVDFINEKAMRYKNQISSVLTTSAQVHGLRDPLFSSRQHLVFDEEELVPEVIYDESEMEETIIVETAEPPDAETESTDNFEHHNYFVIDPEDFLEEPMLDIGIPNPYTNERLINVKLATDANNLAAELRTSASLEKLLNTFEAAPSMSNSQESKDTNTTNSTTETTSTALVESSTSTNSTSSHSSSNAIPASSAQTTLQRTKKKLTFLNLSPFRAQKQHSEQKSNPQKQSDNKSNEHAISELVSEEHLLHLQSILQNASSRTVPIELNYVLFNPGPVPSRNVQYKIRKPRPLSTHSDADSGFLSPCSPDELRTNPAILVLQQCDSVQGYMEIYTDWANYYLDRAKSKRKVTDLSADCRDGLLLADVIEAVTGFKVPDLVKKPKNQQQMYDNVNSCLNVLRSQTVAGLDNITTNDICAGRLKAVLALFFALSRFKQQTKQTKTASIAVGVVGGVSVGGGGSVVGIGVGGSLRQSSSSLLLEKTHQQIQQHQQQANTATNANVVVVSNNSPALAGTTTTCAVNQQQQQQQREQSLQNGNEMVNRQIPTAYSKANGGTAIPLPATVMVQRRCPPDKVRPLPPTPNHTPSIPGLGKSGSEFHTSRPNSPPTSNHTIQSLKSGNNNGLRPPTIKAHQQSGIPSSGGVGGGGGGSGGGPTTAASTAVNPPQQKHSMLDKLKLFNKDKQPQQQNAANKTQIQSKRTSSSSGFSSARSERSDSSLSLNDGHISQIKPPTVSVTASKAQKANSTKQSKLLAAQQKKEQAKAGKLDKKERSPARSLHKEEVSGVGMQQPDSRTSTLSRTAAKNSLPRSVGEKNTMKTSSKTSLHSKSDSKSSLNMAAAKNLNSPSGTGLPKPIAAIKGTSKLPQPGDNKLRMTNSNSQHELLLLKREKSDISATGTNSNISEQQQHQAAAHHQRAAQNAATAGLHTASHIIKPVPILPEPVGLKPPPYYANTTPCGYLSEPGMPLRNAEHSYGTRLPPAKAGGLLASPNTRKLEFHGSGSNMLTPTQRSPMRHMNQSPIAFAGTAGALPAATSSASSSPSSSSVSGSSSAMQCNGGESPHISPNKFHTVPTKIVGTIYESQEEKPVSVLPMRPLLRGYNSHVTLPTRGARGQHQHYVSAAATAGTPNSDYGDSDIGQGYCSDGDALRVSSARMAGGHSANSGGHHHGLPASRFHQQQHQQHHPHHHQPQHGDIDNGYLSEGSSGIGLGAGAHGKHFLSLMRARTQLPTTIEERIRNSRGSLDSIGTAPPSSAASQASSSGGSTSAAVANNNNSCSNNKMDGANGSAPGSANGSPQHQHQHQHQHHQHHHLQQQQQHQHQQQQQQHRATSRTAGRDNWSKMPEPPNGYKAERAEKSSPSRRSMGGSGSASKQGSPSGRSTKGVPPSFGYVKRANGSIAATAEQQNIMMIGGGGSGCLPNGMPSGRTAHVSAVPRTTGGRKISGGTQTLPNDVTKIPPNTQHRSFSLTGPTATQLSQSIRERLATGSHSLPKPGSDLHMFQHRIANRPGKMHDGSLSDTQTYAEVKPEYNSYAMWLKHSNTAGSRLSEGDSMENMQIGSPAMTRHGHKMIHNRASGAMPMGGGTHVSGTESPYVQSPRLNRSNSIRSTKSEKLYPSMLSRGPDVEIEPYYCLPVGTIAAAAQNGVISAQMAAAAAAAAAGHVGSTGTGVAQAAAGSGAMPVAWSQPTSPTPVNRGFGAGGPLSPTHGVAMGLVVAGNNSNSAALTGAGGHRLTYPKKNDEVHGSAASLLSGGSSLYGSAEERQAHEIRRLKRELLDAREQVLSLSSQLSTNAHVVSAFEQSLSNMTNRLQHLTATAERKDGELTDMRQTIELLRKQSIQAGLTTAHMQSMGVQTQSQNQNELLANANISKPPPLPTSMPGRGMSVAGVAAAATANGSTGVMQRHHSTDSMCSLNSISSGCSAHDKKQKKKGWLRSSFTKAFSRNAKISKTSRHVGQHHHQHHLQHGGAEQPHHGMHGSPKANGHGHMEQPVGLAALATQPTPQMPPTSPAKCSPAKTVTLIENAKPIDAIDSEDHQIVEDLKKQLREKDLVLTDIRLEALSSASQLESLKDTVNKMRAEMLSLKQNNERLQKLVTTRSLAGSEASLGNAISPNGSIGDSRRYSLADGNARPPMELPKRLEEEVEEENIPPAPAPEPPTAPPAQLSPSTHIDLTPPPPALEPLNSPAHIPSAVEELPDVTDGKKIAIACYLGQPDSFAKYCEEMFEIDDFYANSEVIASHEAQDGSERKSFPSASLNEFVIAYTYISGKTTWQNLDYIVRKTFKDYAARIDPGTNLGLNTDSITSYHLGEAKRGPEMGFPELLPCGYIIGNVRTLYICLQGVGSLAFDSLIPRSIVHRYISLLTEHRRLILCGPSGTGKSYLARRLAEFLVARSGRGNPSEAIATFNVDHKSSKDLRQYLSHIAEQAAIANGASELPSVIILDNLHHASALGDVFSCLLSAGPAAKLPCIIGTMSQATCNTTNLQLHHNFRWVLTANHMEPVKGFLGRFLRRRLFQLELQTQHAQPELATVLAWLPTVWQHINRFLEVHSSSDVTIGPRLFLSCPLDLKDSQVWFTDIWNYHLSPYLVEAVREGVQLYGRRGGAWNDPSAFIRNSYPWPYGPDSVPPLRQINAEDVGLEGVAVSTGDNQDPLLNMLMRLQEAANYSEHQDQESDCASLDSNITPDSSAGAE